MNTAPWRLPLLLVAVSLCVRCGSPKAPSDLNHLTAEMPECDIDSDATMSIWNRIDGQFTGNRDLAFQYAQQLSVLPSAILEFVVGRIERGEMSLYFTGTSRADWIGETFGGFDGSYPVRQGFQPNSYAVTSSALHEVGHAVSYYSYEMQDRGDEVSDIQRGFQDAMASEGHNIWTYARSSRYEWFASAFSHFMCSKAQRQGPLRHYFPSSLEFLTRLYGGFMTDQ